MSTKAIFFNPVFLHNTLLLVSGTNAGQELPNIDNTSTSIVSNEKAIIFSSGDYVEDFNLPLKVLAGNVSPKKLHRLYDGRIVSDNKTIYIGDNRKESFMTLDFESDSVELSLWIDSENAATLLYVFIDSSDLQLVKRQNYLQEDQNIKEEINKLGKQNGCHICGSKDESEYIPHLLPPLELEINSEKSWFPICKSDSERYEAEIDTALREMI
jgi:hypothetical protein